MASKTRQRAPYVHPLYARFQRDWEFYQLAYEGGREYLEQYLSRHAKELLEYWQDRVDRGVYPNIVRNVVDTYVAHIFHQPVVRDEPAPDLEQFFADVDLRGTGADEFYAEVLGTAMVFGAAAVLTDRHEPDTDSPPLTRAQERELGRRPYSVILNPLDIVDWETDRLGRLLWLIHRDESGTDRAPASRPTEGDARFKLWTRTGWQRLAVDAGEKDADSTYRVIEEGEHPVGRVPVQFVFYGRRFGRHIVGESSIKDLSRMGRRITNLTSLIDEQAFQHVFNILAIPDAMFEQLKKMNFAVAGTITFPDDATHPPFYLAPDVSQLTVLREELRETMLEARVLSGLGRMNEDSRAGISGRSMAFQTMDKVALLEKLAQRMEGLEIEVERDALAWMESTGEPIRPEYDRDYDPDSLSAQLEEALMFDSFGVGGLAKRETLKAITRSYLGGKVEADVLAEMLADIDARYTPSEEPEAAQGEPGTGLGGVMVETGEGSAQDAALNGAQVKAMVELTQLVSAGQIAAESAIMILRRAFGVDETVASGIISPSQSLDIQPEAATPSPPPAPPEAPQN